MANKTLEVFGSLVVRRIRTEAIEQWRATVAGELKDEGSRALHAELRTLDPACRAFISDTLAKVVDTTVFKTLALFEQEHDALKVLVRNEESGALVDVVDESDGLAGELFGERGWISRFGASNAAKKPARRARPKLKTRLPKR